MTTDEKRAQIREVLAEHLYNSFQADTDIYPWEGWDAEAQEYYARKLADPVLEALNGLLVIPVEEETFRRDPHQRARDREIRNAGYSKHEPLVKE